MLLSSTWPLNRSFIGPILASTVALNARSPARSMDSQPGMHDFSTAGSFRACHTACLEASIRCSPDSSIARARLVEGMKVKLGRTGFRGRHEREASATGQADLL